MSVLKVIVLKIADFIEYFVKAIVALYLSLMLTFFVGHVMLPGLYEFLKSSNTSPNSLTIVNDGVVMIAIVSAMMVLVLWHSFVFFMKLVSYVIDNGVKLISNVMTRLSSNHNDGEVKDSVETIIKSSGSSKKKSKGKRK